jgi:hypothetical protein
VLRLEGLRPIYGQARADGLDPAKRRTVASSAAAGAVFGRRRIPGSFVSGIE